MTKSNGSCRNSFGGDEDAATWLCLLTVFLTLWS